MGVSPKKLGTMRVFCPDCRGMQKCSLVAAVGRSDEEFAFIDEFVVCQNGDHLFARVLSLDYERGGDWQERAPRNSERIRQIPSWTNRLRRRRLRELRSLMGEVCTALNGELLVLATAGIRTMLDVTMDEILDGDIRGFARKLQAMQKMGHISENEHGLLTKLTDVCHAAAHRAHRPRRDHVEAMLDAVETLIHRHFVLRRHIDAAQERAPRRTRAATASPTIQ